MPKDETKESPDQPEEESNEDQTVEESEEEESEASEETDDDQSDEEVEEEEDSEEELFEVGGEMLTREEVVKGYMRNKDYTQKTQSLSQQQKQMAAMLENMNKPKGKEIPAEDQAVIDRLRGYGFVPQQEVEQLITRTLATHNVANERNQLKKEYNFDDAMLNAVYSYSVSANVSLKEAAQKFAQPKKVIKKKGLSVSGGKPSSVNKANDTITKEGAKSRILELSKKRELTPKEKKEFDTIRTRWEKGELQ